MLIPVLAAAVLLQEGASARVPAQGYTLFLEALALRESGQIDRALTAFQRVLAADPNAVEAHAEIARIRMGQARFDQAVASVDAAIKIAPDRADLRSLAGMVHQFYAQSGGGEAQLRAAVVEYEAAARLRPVDPAPLRDLTRIYSVLRDADGALRTWKRLTVADPLNIDAFIQVATLSLGTGDAEGAAKALETALAADPENTRVLQLLGDLKRQAGHVDEALTLYARAARLEEKDLVTRLKMGEMMIEAKRADEALRLADEMLRQDAKNRFALDLKARAFKELRRIDEALDIARGLAASDPTDLKAAFLVVTTLEAKGAFEEAETRLGELVRRNTAGEDPQSIGQNNRVFWAHAGMVRQRLGRFREAADAYGEASRATSEKDLSLVTYRIDALLSAKEYALALKESRAALSEPAFKDATDLKMLEAYALKGAGDEKGADAVVDALASGAAQTEDLLSAAEYYQRARNYERARAMFASAAAKDPKSLRAQFSLGAVLERLKRHDEAERAFRQALAIDPESAITLNYLGYMNADRNVRVPEALGFIQKALEQDPANGSYLDSLAWALHRLGRNQEAEVAIRKAVDAQEKSAVVMAHFGIILAANGEPAEALKYLQAALVGEDEENELDRRMVEDKIRSLSKAAQKK
jgi:tetratricopeptide (TPR) repeat protein